MELNWIDALLDENKHVETPESWLWWSLLSCISACAGNNYFLATLKGDLVYKPNLFIMLLGESGLGKGYPVNLAKRLAQKADVTRVIAGRSSIQAIVTELSTTRTKEGKAPIQDSRGFIVNGELSTAIIADPDSLTILTDLYDGQYNSEWNNMLKGTGVEKLKNPYITALFGSSPSHFYDSVPEVNINGGYVGRNLIVYEDKRSHDVDLLDNEDDVGDSKFDSILVPKYIPHLTKIASKSGQLKPSSQAKEFFNSWRRKWRATQPPDKTGFINRVPDHSLKVAMCLCLANFNFNGEIQASQLEQAIEKVTSLIYANKKTVEGRGPDPLAQATKATIDYLLAAPNQELTRKQLLWKGYGLYNSFTLDQILENLGEMGWIRKAKVGVGSNLDWLVRLAGEPLDNYLQYVKDKESK